ncbi:MAG: GxxExxY protein [Cyclobacteriaceae bacterium]|nr:GxxExxY protein [Cyclobacteriaceae bacterium]
MFTKLSQREEYIASQLVDIAIKIHKSLGPGLLESVYEKCFSYELNKRDLSFVRQKEVPIHYESLLIENGLRLDLLVENLVVVELKAQENFHPVWEAQLLSYLRLTNKRLGLLINFYIPLLKDGIRRLIL